MLIEGLLFTYDAVMIVLKSVIEFIFYIIVFMAVFRFLLHIHSKINYAKIKEEAITVVRR